MIYGKKKDYPTTGSIYHHDGLVFAVLGCDTPVRERGVHGYLDHTGTAVLTGTGLPAPDAAAAAARLDALADQLRAAGYSATLNQTRADLYLRLLDGTLDGLTTPQIQTAMLTLGCLTPPTPTTPIPIPPLSDPSR